MVKILMTSVRDDEEFAIKRYAQNNDIEIDISREEFHPNTAPDLSQYDGLVIQQTASINGDASFYKKLVHQGLKQITTRTAGYDMVEVILAKNAGLKVTNVPAYSPRSVAEMALMQIFRLLRRTLEFEQRLSRNDFRWQGLQSKEIHTVTVGIIGAGRIGGTLAKLLSALGTKVIAYDVNSNPALEPYLSYVTKQTLLTESDVISLHVDLNSTTVDLINCEDFSKMKKDALLVNASRGPVINTDDLITALETNQIAAAALDTVENESQVFNKDLSNSGIPDHRIQKLMMMPNVLITPHVAFFTNTAVENMVDISLNDVMTIISGQKSEHEI